MTIANVAQPVQNVALKVVAFIAGLTALSLSVPLVAAIGTACVIGSSTTLPFLIPVILIFGGGTLITAIISKVAFSKSKTTGHARINKYAFLNKCFIEQQKIQKKSPKTLQKMIPISLSESKAQKMVPLITRYRVWKAEEKIQAKNVSRQLKRVKGLEKEAKEMYRNIHKFSEAIVAAKVNAAFQLAVMKNPTFKRNPKDVYKVPTGHSYPCYCLDPKFAFLSLYEKETQVFRASDIKNLNHAKLSKIFSKAIAA